MAQWNRDLISDDSLELISCIELGDDVGVVRMNVVIGSDSHLESFAGDADDAFRHVAVAVSRVGQGVKMIVSSGPAFAIDLVLQRESDRDGLILFDRDRLLMDAPFRPATGIDQPVADRNGDTTGP